MPKRLNIRSDEAYQMAMPEREVSPEVAAETFRVLEELSRQGARLKKPGATSDHSDLYDEHGLPI